LIHWQRLNHSHIPELYRIALAAEPFRNRLGILQFEIEMGGRDGLVFFNGADMIGAATLGEYVPAVDITMHCFILPSWQKRWLTRKALKEYFSIPFVNLGLERVSGFYVKGLNDSVAVFQRKLGFIEEGTKRRAYMQNGKFYDVVYCGMLRAECRWL